MAHAAHSPALRHPFALTQFPRLGGRGALLALLLLLAALLVAPPAANTLAAGEDAAPAPVELGLSPGTEALFDAVGE